ncbi:hypothetical protein CYY_005980 [Polysphondylium violaceum]|uniref:Ankyrin repeat-containing protein n=1 Tax=Polysphondylium violaceum TaxID=133409 RepID=A0A8J4PRP0_9MYCE|nr:hypothetical protein CYY_005980 [Polysphondylium violaceum]
MPLTSSEQELINAIQIGDVITVSILITPRRSTRKPKVDIYHFKDEKGHTALHYCAKHDQLEIIKKIFLAAPKINRIPQTNRDKLTPFHFAIYYNSEEIASFLHSHKGRKTSKDQYRILTELILKKDDPKAFRLLLRLISRETPSILLNKAKEKIKKFLDYKPSRHYLKVQEVLERNNHINDQDYFQRLLNDEENTSEEESSDSEPEGFHVLSHKKKLPKKLSLLYRGVHYNPQYFKSTKDRQKTFKKSYHKKPAYSKAVYELATTRVPKKENGKFNYKKADKLVKNYFKFLKLTPDREERKLNGRKVKRVGMFDSLYEHLIQAYINSYNDLFENEGLTRNFNFCNNSNPLLSAIPRIECTSKFITGHHPMSPFPYQPKLRKSTGSFKHCRIGYVHVYAVEKDHKDLHDVSQLANIHVGARRERDEVYFESSIQPEHILGYQIFSIPKFNKRWSKEIQLHYGLGKGEYKYYSDKLEQSEFVSDLIQKVTNHQLKILKIKIDNLKNQKVTSDIDDIARKIDALSLKREV